MHCLLLAGCITFAPMENVSAVATGNTSIHIAAFAEKACVDKPAKQTGLFTNGRCKVMCVLAALTWAVHSNITCA